MMNRVYLSSPMDALEIFDESDLWALEADFDN